VPDMDRKNRLVLALQGGGALGAYQAGVLEGIHQAGAVLDEICAVSIGAVNAATFLGNQGDHRIRCLRQFWDIVRSRTSLARLSGHRGSRLQNLFVMPTRVHTPRCKIAKRWRLASPVFLHEGCGLRTYSALEAPPLQASSTRRHSVEPCEISVISSS